MADTRLRKILATVAEWFTRRAALDEVRAHRGGEAADQAFQQAKLLLEVARRTADPVEPLPKGSRAAVLLTLYRDAAYWALVAERPVGAPHPADLKAAWEDVPHERRLWAAGGPEMMASARRALLEAPLVSIDVRDEDVFTARAFAEAVYHDLAGPRVRSDRLITQRWIRIAAAVVLLIVAGVGTRALVLGPNLAEGKPFRVSSSWAGCSGDAGCQQQLFHTDPQNNPWVEFDLGAPKSVHRIEITNRDDCCAERVAPLIAEVSLDANKWTEVAKNEKVFSTWTAKFPPKVARYVRLRVPRDTVFHLKEVAIR
jgi:hypothetical protein